jgi:hypothetical protein
MNSLQKYCVFLILPLLLFNKWAISAEPSFIVNIPLYQVIGSTHYPFAGTNPIEPIATDFLPCVGAMKDCLAQTYQNWVQVTGSEGCTVIDEREHNCCVTVLYRFTNHEFDKINIVYQRPTNPFGTFRGKYDLLCSGRIMVGW